MTILSVVIPAYNEENGIAEICHRILNICDELKEVHVDDLELIVVDDGSSDRTVEIARKIDGVRLVCHKQNQGYGSALKTGFAISSGELIGFMDADGTYPPEYYPALCKEALNGYELVIGSRMAGAGSQMPQTRRIGNFFFANLLSLIGNQRVSDSASGMRVFRREILERIYPLPDGLNLTPVMSTRAIHENIKMKEVPIPYSERVGRSKLSVVHDGRIFLQSMIWTALTYNPVRILGIISMILLGMASLIGFGLIAARINGINSLGPWGVIAVFTAMVSAIVGVSLFALGTIFNYLVAIFHKQPMRQGMFEKTFFRRPLNHHFAWMGVASLSVGTIVAGISFSLGLSGWPIDRLWFWLLGSAMVTLIGVQLNIYWILLRVLEELGRRELEIQEENNVMENIVTVSSSILETVNG
jgi:glycosyltransferase involved in cell wall biosynthesis